MKDENILTWYELSDEEQDEMRQRYMDLFGFDSGVLYCRFFRTESGDLIFA